MLREMPEKRNLSIRETAKGKNKHLDLQNCFSLNLWFFVKAFEFLRKHHSCSVTGGRFGELPQQLQQLKP